MFNLLPYEIQNYIYKFENIKIKNRKQYVHALTYRAVHHELNKKIKQCREEGNRWSYKPQFFFPDECSWISEHEDPIRRCSDDNWWLRVQYGTFRHDVSYMIRDELKRVVKQRMLISKNKRSTLEKVMKRLYELDPVNRVNQILLLNPELMSEVNKRIISDTKKRLERKQRKLDKLKRIQIVESQQYFNKQLYANASLAQDLIPQVEEEEVDEEFTRLQSLFTAISNMVESLENKLQFTISAKHLERLALSIASLIQCRTKTHFMTTALMCVSQATNKTLFGIFKEHFTSITSELWEVMKEQVRPQGHFRDAITSWERMSDSRILDKLREFMSFCMTFGALEWFGFSENVASIVYGEFKATKRHKSVFSFALAFCDVLEFVLSRLAVCIETGTIGPLFHSVDDYANWYDTCNKIVDWNLMLGQDHFIRPFTDQEFQTTCEDALKKGEEYIKFAKSIKDRREIGALVSRVRIIYGDFQTSEIVGRPRMAPFSVLITGDSSIGKTSIMFIMRSIFAHLANLPDDPRYFYTRDPNDEFMSGYKSYMWFLCMDDVATTNPKLLSDIDKSVAELFKYIQNIACTANMADLKEKGKIAIRPEFVVASSNAPTLNAEAMFTCPSAARRRLPWRITPTVRPEFRIDPGTNMLDPSKCEYIPGKFPDYWTFDVDEIRPKPLRNAEGAINLDAQEIPVLRQANLREFLKWFIDCAKTHRERQRLLKERMDNAHAIEKCKHSLPKYLCCGEVVEQTEFKTIAITTAISSFNVFTIFMALLMCVYLRLKQQLFMYRNNLYDKVFGWPKRTFHRLTHSYEPVGDELSLTLRNVSRSSISEIGRRAQDFIMSQQGVGISVILGAIAIWRLSQTKSKKHEVKNIVQEQLKFVAPVPRDEKTKIIWNQPLPIVDRCNILPQSISSKALSREQFIESVSHNVAHVTCIDPIGMKQWRMNMFFVGGFDVIMNTHLFERIPDVTQMTFLFHPKFTHIGLNTTILFDKRRVLHKQNKDITLIRLENFGVFKSFKNYFAKGELNGSFNCTTVHRNPEGTLELISVLGAKLNSRDVRDKPYRVYEGHVRSNTIDGTCGAPLVMETSYGFVIGGIHSLGGAHQIAASSVVLHDLFDPLDGFDIGECNLGELDEQVLEINEKPFLREPVTLTPELRSRDPFAWRESGLAMVYGSLSTGPAKPRSSVESGFTRDFWESKGMSTNCIAPVFSSKNWHKGLDDMMSQDMLISNSEIIFISECLTRDFINGLTREDMEIIELYDRETAINGADLVNGVDKLDFNTSTGFPLKKPKKSIFIQMPNGKYSCPQEVLDECDKIERNLQMGKRSQVIFSASLKDEPRDRKKVEEGSIRIFMGAPLPYCIVMRQYFLSLCRLIQRNPLKFETAVGINSHSNQWDNLAQYLLDMSNNFVVGDHSKYDKRMLAMVIYNMFKVAINVIIHCLLVCGKIEVHEENQLRFKMQLLAIDTAYAFIDFNGTLVSFLKNHVSGHILTVIINSFTNSSYIRMAYLRCVDDDPYLEKFQSRCRVVTYGDDFITAVHDDFVDKINFITLKENMAKFGVIITPAIKNSDDYLTVPITEIDFLKRKFKFCEELGRWVGPLDVKSIEKSLLISVRSKSITAEEQAIFTMMSANQEMFFHGREAQEKFRQNVLECIAFYRLEYLYQDHLFPTYDEFLHKYLNSSYVNVGATNIKKSEVDIPLDYGEENLVEQCECQNIMKLNSSRLRYDPGFEKVIERPYSKAFDGRFKKRFRQLVGRIRCDTPYGFSCTSFCGYCQLTPASDYCIDTLIEDYYTSNLSARQVHCRFSDKNTLTRVEQATYSVDETTEGRDHLYGHHYLSNCGKEDNEVHPQMSETNIEFVDEVAGSSCDLSQLPEATRTNEDLDSATFEHYLSRPVQIYTTTWNENASLNLTFNPWLLWAQQSSIKSKLNNYSLFRGNLHLKMLVNASPFYYGAGRLTYEPLINYMRRDTVGNGTYDSGYMIPKSQQRGFEFYPQTSQGGEMVLPFFYPKTWVDITSSTDLFNMGRCSLFSYTPLLNANSVTTAAVTISIIAWCENPELSGPTYTLAVQSEYKKLGPISGPASAVAEAARSLAKIPVLKPYAMGTEVIASGIGSVAKYFGFTNVPNTSAQSSIKPASHYGMATTEISTPYEKLSLDDKNELTVDPRTVGLPPKDEMVLSELLTRESYLTSATWTAAAAANTKLFNTWITPNLYDFTKYPDDKAVTYYQPPMAHISRLFSNWRGNIIFRFRFVCTAFHKGRVRITWDPKTDLSAVAASSIQDTVTTSFTKIIDIGETQDVEMEIPYMQALAFMRTYLTSGNDPKKLYNITSLPVIASGSSYFNGSLSITVLNAQTSPVTSSDITMLVFVRAGENFTLANPQEAPFFSCLAPQVEEQLLNSGDSQEYLNFVKRVETGDLMKIHMGESIHSIRQLIHRQNFYTSFVGKQGNDVQSAGTYNRWVFPMYPQLPGYMNSGRGQFAYAKGIVNSTGTYPVSYCAPSVFNHMAPLYIGARGSIVYNVNVDAPQPTNLISLARTTGVSYEDKSATTKKGWYEPVSWDIYNPSSLGGQAKYRAQTFANGAAGRVITNQNTQAGLMAHYPYYSSLRFTSAVGYIDSAAGTLGVPVEDQFLGVELIVSTKNNQLATVGNETATIVDVYMMAGHDFSFLYFNCVPTFYWYLANYSDV